jgi:hypothetical protein
MKRAAPGRCNGTTDRPAPTEAIRHLLSASEDVVNKYLSLQRWDGLKPDISFAADTANIKKENSIFTT